MSQNDKPETHDAPPAAEDKASIADTVFDIGLEWAAYGLNAGKNALELSANTLFRTAGLLARVRDELSQKSDGAPSEPSEPSEPKAA
jgi:hypothetical protein